MLFPSIYSFTPKSITPSPRPIPSPATSPTITMQSLTPTQLLNASFFTLLTLTLTLHTLLPLTPSLLHFPHLLPFLSNHKVLLFSLSWCTLVALLAYLSTRPKPLLLLDYSCFIPDPDRRCSIEVCEYLGRRSHRISPQSEEFMHFIYERSGLGDETYAPPYIFQYDYAARLKYGIQEVEEGMFSTIQSLLSKTQVDPSQITVLIVASSMFTPCPSLSSLIVHRFGLPSCIKTFSLSGMGCIGGTMSIDLVAKILRRRIGYALIVATESTGFNWYFGDDRHMLVTNCIFRAGAAAALLTNDQTRRGSAKMELVQTLRTHHGADDAAYFAAVQREDDEGNVGVALTQDLVRVAGAGLRRHITTLAPRVLPVSEIVRYAYSAIRSYLSGEKNTHVPDFTRAFEHMCFHTGGKAVIDAVGRIMKLKEEVIEPARMCLHRFGNTSSSCVFYELAYFEAKGRIRTGDRVWMLAFGTGFKSCSLVWRALRDSCMDPDSPWKDCIHRYPVQVVRGGKKKYSIGVEKH